MRSRTLSDEHQAVATRRLELLAHELDATRVRDRPDAATHTRVTAPTRRPEPEPVSAPPEPPAVPVPGRHAARREVRLAPDTLRGRVALAPAHLTVVSVLVTLGLAVTFWWVLRGDPEPAPVVPAVLASPAAAPSDPLAVPSDGASASAPAGVPVGVTVDVAGRVRRPGIVVLDAGARVVDAVEAAGGARAGVDLGTLNLARLLVDGEQIVVGEPAAGAPPVPTGPAPGTVPGTAGAPAALVDLNLADQPTLETLPGVGPVTATAIIAWREEHGGFTAVAELLEVDGIGEKTLADLTPLVTV